jgi:sigma-B regulation protein RsbU (phosphoserine phosphatase)
VLEFKDFVHLPEMDTLIAQLVAERPGLVLVAGLDPRPIAPAQSAPAFLPSGRSTFFGILVRQMLAAHRRGRAVVLAQNKDAVRLPRGVRDHVEYRVLKPPLTYREAIARAMADEARLLVVDQLTEEAAGAALDAAKSGQWVVSQLDCVFCGANVARHLLDLGAAEESLDGLTWVISVQRLATLCPHCKEPAQPDSAWLDGFQRRHPGLSVGDAFFRASGCVHCHQTGRQGDVAIFDVFRAPKERARLFDQPSELSVEEYALQLARRGQVAIDDIQRLDADQLRRTYLLLTASERALATTNAELQHRLAELQVAHRLLQQRTESLVSLQEIAHTLITSTELNDLAKRISRFGHDLCGADKSILYVFQPDGSAEILSVNGWDPTYLHQKLEGMAVLGSAVRGGRMPGGEPTPYSGYPPGIPARPADLAGEALRAGLRVPLIAQNEVVGLMIVHSTRKAQFMPGEISLLQTFANQAALAIQRTGLVEALRHKIEQLTAAQAELVQKERLESELELARQVQQSLLPRRFPQMAGYAFAARNEAARRVGGDFYDAFQLDEHHFGVVIADVSDKGMPAALFMMLTRSLLLAEARRELSPLKVLTSVHHLLLELGEPDMFVTLFYGVVDMRTQELTYARAGHEEPFLLRAGSVQRLGGRGRFLGLLESQEMALSEETVALEPNDRLVLYTDGFIDALSPEQEPFGVERFERLLGSHAQLAPDELCAKAFQVLTAYRGTTEQFDDMAILVVQVKENSKP